ncbi:MAG: tyrosine recombinase XerC, partial [Marinomonas sp.]
MSLISPAARDALALWLDAQKSLKGAAANTITAYQGDVAEFLSFMTTHRGQSQGLGALANICVRDMRSWMAHMRGSGTGARSLARKLSAVKTFYGWLAEREGFEATAVLSARSPKFQKKLPRPLAEDAARAMIDTVELQSQSDWVAARDVAVVTVLYGCGLRISEALGLKGKDTPLPDVLRIVGKGGKERIVPVLNAAREAVNSYTRLCPHTLGADAPLFRGVRGGALNPRAIQKSMAAARMQLGLPATATPHAMRHSFATHLLSAGG